MSQRRALGITAASVLVLGLAACEGGSEEPSPSATTVATSSAAPTEPETTSAEPTQPAVAAPDPADYPGMDQQTEDGAKQAYRYFWDVYLYAELSRDATLFAEVSGPDCHWCTEHLTAISDGHPPWSSATISHGDFLVQDFSQAATTVFHDFDVSATDSETSATTQPFRAVSDLSWSGTRWIVDSVDTTIRS